jgi:succinoglycan biosynthesis transport protein ExoP
MIHGPLTQTPSHGHTHGHSHEGGVGHAHGGGAHLHGRGGASGSGDDDAVGDVDLLRYWMLLVSQWWVIVLAVSASLGLAWTYLGRAPKIYASMATLEVQSDSKKVSAVQQLMPPEMRGNEALKTAEQALMGSQLLLRVIQETGLDQNPTFTAPLSAGRKHQESELVELFLRKLTVNLRRGTRLIDISIEDESPELARTLVETLVNRFLKEDLEQKLSVSHASSEALTNAAEKLKLKLQESEKKLQEYREKHRAVSLEERQNIIVDKLKDLNFKATSARELRLRLESDVNAIKKERESEPENLLRLASIATNSDVDVLRKRLQERRSEFSVVKERYLELHPRYQQMEVQVTELEEALRGAVLKAAEQVIHSYEAALSVEGKLAAALTEQENLSLKLHALSIPYNVLVREVESDRALYASVLNGLKEANASSYFESSNMRLMDPPMTAFRPIRPKPMKILLAAGVAGILAGIGFVLVFDALRGTIRSVSDVESGFGLPVLGFVPSQGGTNLVLRNVVHSSPASAQAEAFRFLRASIELLGKLSEHRVTVFASAIGDEGKSYCAINYAASLAQQGHRTLLIDADLRKPRLAQVLIEGKPFEDGLSDCLIGIASLTDTCQSTRFFNLSLLGAGHRAPNPSELLGASSLRELVQEAMEKFDRVVIDTSPVNIFADALLVSQCAQSICLVIRANSTRRRAVKRALRLFSRASRKPDGVVLNGVKLGKEAIRNLQEGWENLALAKAEQS